MTIDATKSPTPVWQRTLVAVLLATLLVVAGYYLWKHDFHKSQSSPSANVPANAQQVPAGTPAKASIAPALTTTTIPGGIPISARNPFSS